MTNEEQLPKQLVLVVRMSQEGRLGIAAAPFLVRQSHLSPHQLTAASQIYFMNKELRRLFADAGLDVLVMEPVSISCLQGGLICPSRAALRDALEWAKAHYRDAPQSVRLLGKRLVNARESGSQRSASRATIDLAFFTAATECAALSAIAEIAQRFPEHFEEDSLKFIEAYRNYHKVINNCVEERSGVIANGLEAQAVYMSEQLITHGYERIRVKKIETALQKVTQADATGAWRTICLANKAAPSSSIVRMFVDEPTIQTRSRAKNTSAKKMTDFLALTTSGLADLADQWFVMPHLHTPEQEHALWQFCDHARRFLELGPFTLAWVCKITLAQFCTWQLARKVDPTMRAVWLARRRSRSLILEIAQSFLPSAEVCRPALLVQETEDSTKVRVQPAMEWPEAQLLPARELARATAETRTDSDSPLTSCDDGLIAVGFDKLASSADSDSGLHPNPHWDLANGTRYANGRLHLINGLYRIALALPDVFANLSFLRAGSACIPLTSLNDRMEENEDVLEATSNRNSETNKWAHFLPVSGYRVSWLDARSAKANHTNQAGAGCPRERLNILVCWHRARSKPLVRVSFSPQLGDKAANHLASLGISGLNNQEREGWSEENISQLFDLVSQALRTGAAKGPSAPPEGQSISFSELLEAFGDLTLEPRFEFQVGEEIFSITDWESARKVGKDYVVGDKTLLSAAEYNQCLEIYILRKKALARFGAVKIADVWTLQQYTTPPGSEQLDPLAYLSVLRTNLEPLLAFVNSGLTRTVAESLQEPSTVLGRSLATIRADLHPYQVYGVAWIFARLKMGLGALLADDMGLGKTLQAIATLHLLRATSGRQLPTLVVCPKSVAPNWKHEIIRFLPAGSSAIETGHGHESLKMLCLEDSPLVAGADLVIASYPQLRMRQTELARLYPEWGLMILDEAHAIKNAEAQIAHAVRSLKVNSRLALTGTPIENRASELWSLMDWLNPGILGKRNEFESYVRLSRSNDDSIRMLTPVHEILKPVLLRRLKTDPEVDLQLPEKTIKTHYVKLSQEQEVLYETVLLTAMNPEFAMKETSFAKQSRLMLALLRLKQICNHPDIFYSGDEDKQIIEDEESLGHIDSKKIRQRVKNALARRELKGHGSSNLERSGKMEALSELLADLKLNDGGILIFTQFRKSAEMICDRLAHSGIPGWQETSFFHGGLTTGQRQQLIADFQTRCQKHREALQKSEMGGRNKQKSQDHAAPVLVVSLKAGGTGLNLTCANQVIHFDRWWNPAVEDQATDRAHRIGQNTKVTVTHLVTECTIEEGIEDLLASKRSLAADLLGMGASTSVNAIVTEIEGFLGLADPQKVFRGRSHISTSPRNNRSVQTALKKRRVTARDEETLRLTSSEVQ